MKDDNYEIESITFNGISLTAMVRDKRNDEIKKFRLSGENLWNEKAPVGMSQVETLDDGFWVGSD